VWNYAKQHDFIIVTKDSDFSDLLILLGFPPKVIWIRRGNCSTNDIEQILRDNHSAIMQLESNEDAGILTLF
jgi:predicted nuclease of predicted toxin-antitoxin system